METRITGQHPCRLLRRCRQTTGDVWQRDVGDGRIEHLHEHRHHHAHRDEPGIVARMPVRLRCACGHGGNYLPAPAGLRFTMKRKPTVARIARMMATIAVTKSGTPNVATWTRATTESPGPIVRSVGSESSKTIFTGTRWTTLTKLPVAFSGGNKLNCAPLPAWMLSTCARNVFRPMRQSPPAPAGSSASSSIAIP